MANQPSAEVQADLRELDSVLRMALRIVKNARRATKGDPSDDVLEPLLPMDPEVERQLAQADEVLGIVQAFAKAGKDGSAHVADILAEAERGGISQADGERALRVLSGHGSIYQKGGPGTWAPMRN